MLGSRASFGMAVLEQGLLGSWSYRNFKKLMLVLHSSLKFVGVLHLWIQTSLIKESLALLERMVFAPNQSLNSTN